MALWELARMREDAGDFDGAEQVYRQAVDAGSLIGLFELITMRGRARDWDGNVQILQRAGL